MLKTGDVEKLFGVTSQTVRNWTREFADYLSSNATPEGYGAKRNYTTNDLAVFALVVEKTQNGATYEETRKALAAGERAEPPEIDNIEDDIASQLSARELVLISQITKERDMALGKLSQIETDRQQDRETIEKLNREIGKLETLLEIERDKKKGDGS